MKVLVTGGLGFIGSNFVRYLLEVSNYEIVVVDKQGLGANPANLADVEHNSRLAQVRADLENRDAIARLVQNCDAVVHLAAETHVDRSIVDPGAFLRSNTIGTFNLLEAIRQHPVRLLVVSTDEVYGEALDRSYSEVHELRPSNPYSASKAGADLFALAYHRTYGLPVVITRCANNFGPFQFPEKLIPKTIIRAMLGLHVPVYGRGQHVRDWIYVRDHCHALWQVLERGREGEVYNIAGGNERANLDVVRAILEHMRLPDDRIELVADRPGHDRRYSLDASKIQRELGWRPRYSFDEALGATVAWYASHEVWWRPLATPEILHPTPWLRPSQA